MGHMGRGTRQAHSRGPDPAPQGSLRVSLRAGRWYGHTVTRSDLHRLLDALPEESLDPVAVLLQRAHDPGLANRDAGPWEDEPVSADEEQAATEARAEADRGEVTAWDDVKKELLAD